MCLGGGGSPKVKVPKPAPLPPPLPAPPPPKPVEQPKRLTEPTAKPTIKIGSSKPTSSRDTRRAKSSLTINSGSNQGLNL